MLMAKRIERENTGRVAKTRAEAQCSHWRNQSRDRSADPDLGALGHKGSGVRQIRASLCHLV